jgi:F0F1-type ATP synthase membrane subunit b/b'
MAANGLKELVPYAVNFSLFAVSVYFLARKPVKNFVYKRHERMKDFVLDAAKEKQEAVERHTKISKKMEKLAQEEAAILQAAAQEGKQEAASILEKATIEAKRIAADAEQIVANESQERDKQMTKILLDVACGRAEGILSKQLKKEDHSGLVKKAKSVIKTSV